MTYSPLLPLTVHSNSSTVSLAKSDTPLRRINALLHCPVDTPQLWPQVLSILGQSLICTSARLLLPDTLGINPSQRWQAPEHQPNPLTLPVAESISILWRYLGIPQAKIDILWQHQATDLQMQLSELASDVNFCLRGAIAYASHDWPPELTQIFSCEQDQHLLLLPLCDQTADVQPIDVATYESTAQFAEDEALDVNRAHAPAGMGVLLLLRPATESRWSQDEIQQVESIGSQLYLALRRSHLDQVMRTRSAYDQLTQLPDRVLFNQQLIRSVTMAAAEDTMLGVAFLDLDRFKNINDTLGHEAGDCLLKQVASRLKQCLRGYDVVARWGGDEFTLLLSNLRSAEDIVHIAERLLQRLAAPFRVDDNELYVTASLGIALAPYDGEDGQTLLRNADAAMYQAKAKGRNNYQVYFEEINADARNQLNLETDLRKAVDNGELLLCYQPQVDLISGQWIGLEALVRWQHPTLGLISPAKFIPIAEETGLIEPIGHWVLHAACAQYGQWQAIGMPKLRLAVNLSPHQFHRSYLVRSILEVLSATNFDPKYLELEVTESAAMHDVGFAIGVLQKLSHAGMQIAMDDFGTGYSSLSVLKHFPLDTIKIDRSFVMDLVDNQSDAAIASTIIALAKGLHFKVLAEGIETAAQANVLKGMGCDYAQGYLFSRPLSVQQMDDYLKQGTFHDIAKL